MDKLIEWLHDHLIDYTPLPDQSLFGFEITGFNRFLFIQEKGGKVFDENLEILLANEEMDYIEANNIQYVCYMWGRKFYYFDIEKKSFTHPLRYLGKANQLLGEEFTSVPFLGVHGKYELLNGSRGYEHWCQKAKFLGCTSLGLCELNTLAGTLQFQESCEKHGLKPILGETILVKHEELDFYLKLYVMNESGWQTLLRINTDINVNHYEDGRFTTLDYISKYPTDGLVCILGRGTILTPPTIERLKALFPTLYLQIDLSEYLSDEKDKSVLEYYQEVLTSSFYKGIPVVVFSDAYYLDACDSNSKIILNKIATGSSLNQSNDQYFKPLHDSFLQLSSFIEDDKKFDDLFFESLESLIVIDSMCNFKIVLGDLHLPHYELTPEEKEKFKDNESLFLHLIEQGLADKGLLHISKVDKINEYLDRIEKEYAVIKKGGFIDYFLILWDLVYWCKKNNILVGLGRGSSAGSLISYLLDIVKIDPLKYDLLFERFLNESRITKGLPDVDMDFESGRRDEVKEYLRTRYGHDYVVSIGTYVTLQLRAVLKDVGKVMGLDHQNLNYITSMVDPGGQADTMHWFSLFQQASETPLLKEFILKNPEVIEEIEYIFEAPKSPGVHAAGMVIVPKFDKHGTPKEIYDWMPVKKMNGVLVSEWDGTTIDTCGFLKEDILALNQLDKFNAMFRLIKQNHGVEWEMTTIPLDDPKVLKLFQFGYNQDVFQFGASGLSGYCQDLKPDSVEELIAAVSLFRPGTMESNAHTDYVKIKFGKKQVEYDYMLEGVTEKTNGLYVYQEQIMKAFEVLGGFSLVEADGVRKAMGKMLPELMDKYRSQFIEGASKKGCPTDEANRIWNKLEAFARYGFNRSHAACYSIMGYYSQWLKVYYPLEFWSTSLEYCTDQDNIQGFISEISKTGIVKIYGPDLNHSHEQFTNNPQTNSIYWSLSSIKYVGEDSVRKILGVRDEGGPFLSFKDFYDRTRGLSINRRHITSLVIGGGFDQIENITEPKDRLKLLQSFGTLIKADLTESLTPTLLDKNYYWSLLQKDYTGYGYIDFDSLLQTLTKVNFDNKNYVNSLSFFTDSIVEKEEVWIMGLVTEFKLRTSKRGPFCSFILSHNEFLFDVIVWNETYTKYRSEVTKSEGQLMLISGRVVKDSLRKRNVLQTTEKSVIELL